MGHLKSCKDVVVCISKKNMVLSRIEKKCFLLCFRIGSVIVLLLPARLSSLATNMEKDGRKRAVKTFIKTFEMGSNKKKAMKHKDR